MRFSFQITLLCALVVVLAFPAQAEEPPADDQNVAETPESTLNLGAGVAYRSPVYRGQDADYVPIPTVFYEKGKLYFRGNRLGYQFYKNESLTLDILGEFVFRGYDEDDSRHLRGMDDRDPSIEGGIAASYNDGWGTTGISFVTDLLSEHDGQELSFSYAKRFIHEPWVLTPSAGIAWQSGNLTDYYYGVERDEATPDRARYSAGEAWNPFVTLTTQYYFNEKWSTLIMFRYDWLDNEISDSPIVNKNYQVRAFVGVMCKF